MNINFNLESVGKDIAVLKSKNEKNKDKNIYMTTSSEGIRFPLDIIEAQADETIQLSPSIKVRLGFPPCIRPSQNFISS